MLSLCNVMGGNTGTQTGESHNTYFLCTYLPQHGYRSILLDLYTFLLFIKKEIERKNIIQSGIKLNKTWYRCRKNVR